ncbi:MAG: putative porin [Candidatus Omnitrophota bacterium]|nr:putative porin [Candidatus Omnitrophota bacterium]
MRRIFLIFTITILLSPFCQTQAKAGEIDILVKKLVEKGILTHGEARVILTETQEEIRKDMAKGTSKSVPEWVQKIKLKGDLRLRWQSLFRQNQYDAHEARYRYRLGAFAKVLDNLELGAGIASGGDDPRSTNETWDDQFETKDARLDYAYAKWQPFDYLTIQGGKIQKMKNCIWFTSDLLWDGDINPEGITVAAYAKEVYPDIDLFTNHGVFYLDESTQDRNDPWMILSHGGFNWKATDDVHIKTAIGGYFPVNVEGEGTFEHTAGGNTIVNGVYRHHYASLVWNGEIGMKKPVDFINYGAVFSDFIWNPDPGDNDIGFLVGCKIGDKKVKKKGQWQMNGNFRYLEADAWLDIFPDSDAYDGRTNIYGPEVIFQYALHDNVIFGLDWYWTDFINGENVPQSLVQADLLFKF